MNHHSCGVSLELPVALQGFEAVHLNHFHSCYGLPFAWPKSHDLASEWILVTQLALLRQLLLELLNLVLLGIQQGIAPSAFCINRLLFLVVQSTLSFDEFLHGFSSEAQDKLIKTLGKVFAIKNFFHLLGCRISLHYFRLVGLLWSAINLTIQIKWCLTLWHSVAPTVWAFFITDHVFKLCISIWYWRFAYALSCHWSCIRCLNLGYLVIGWRSFRSQVSGLLGAYRHTIVILVSLWNCTYFCHRRTSIASATSHLLLLPGSLVRLHIFCILIFFWVLQLILTLFWNTIHRNSLFSSWANCGNWSWTITWWFDIVKSLSCRFFGPRGVDLLRCSLRTSHLFGSTAYINFRNIGLDLLRSKRWKFRVVAHLALSNSVCSLALKVGCLWCLYTAWVKIWDYVIHV